MTRRKFKASVVLEALKERHSLAELAQKYQAQPIQISGWKRDFLSGAETVFEKGKSDKRSDAEKEFRTNWLHRQPINSFQQKNSKSTSERINARESTRRFDSRTNLNRPRPNTS